MADTHDIQPHGQWKAGAKALHAFQQAAYAAGRSRKGQHGVFSGLKDICKTIQDASKDTGLSHTESWHPLGTDHAILRVTLHHESGESISSELPVDITQKNRSGSREQAQGSAMTYARRYLLLGIYGLANDDEDDDGEATTSTTSSVGSAGQAEKPTTAATSNPDELSTEEHTLCLTIIKDEEHGPEIKKQFMAQFYPNATKLYPHMITTKEQLQFLDTLHVEALKAKAPF